MRRRAIEYQDTAVGRLPRGPAADAALAAAALSAPPEVPAARAALARLVPVLFAAGLAAAIAILAWRRSTA